MLEHATISLRVSVEEVRKPSTTTISAVQKAHKLENIRRERIQYMAVLAFDDPAWMGIDDIGTTWIEKNGYRVAEGAGHILVEGDNF